MTELLLIIALAGQRVAIPAEDVEAVVEIEGLTPIPRAADHVAGLAALRSRVLTVIDCSASIELGRSCVEGAREAIVVEKVVTPVDFAQNLLAERGNAFAFEPTIFQSAGWRWAACRWRC